jgi:hypothetical protein
LTRPFFNGIGIKIKGHSANHTETNKRREDIEKSRNREDIDKSRNREDIDKSRNIEDKEEKDKTEQAHRLKKAN